MIFPQERISDLERDVAIKRDAFYASQDRFLGSARAQMTPGALFKGGLLGGLFGLASFFFAGKFLLRGGMLSSFLKTGALIGIRTVTPMVRPLVTSLLSKILKKFN